MHDLTAKGVSSGMGRVRFQHPTLSGSIYFEKPNDGPVIYASADMKSRVAFVVGKEHEVVMNGQYHKWYISAADLHSILYSLIHK